MGPLTGNVICKMQNGIDLIENLFVRRNIFDSQRIEQNPGALRHQAKFRGALKHLKTLFSKSPDLIGLGHGTPEELPMPLGGGDDLIDCLVKMPFASDGPEVPVRTRGHSSR